MKNRCSVFTLLFMFFMTLSVLYSFNTYAVSIELQSPSNYDTWRPTYNDKITFTVVVSGLHESSEGFSEGSVTLSFSKVSSWVGICMNAPAPGIAQSTPDLRFYPKDQAVLQTELEWVPSSWNTDVGAEDTGEIEGVQDSVSVEFNSNDNLSSFTFTITVRCEDFGAYGILEAKLVDASDGTREWSAHKCVPKDDNGDYIADSWQKDAWDGSSSHIPPADTETGPTRGGGANRVETNTQVGDGLCVFEEYRGFMVGGIWTDLSPKKKDIFVYSDYAEFGAGGLIKSGIGAAYKLPSVFHTHEILKTETKNGKNDRTVNFNSLGAPAFRTKSNEAWQIMFKEAIWVMKDSTTETEYSGWAYTDGTIDIYTITIDARVTEIGNGDNHLGFPEWLRDQEDADGNALTTEDALIYSTLGHEIGHAVGLKHPWEVSLTGTVPMPTDEEKAGYSKLDFKKDTNLILNSPAVGWIGLYAFDNRSVPDKEKSVIEEIKRRGAIFNAWDAEEEKAIDEYDKIVSAYNSQPDQRTSAEVEEDAEKAREDYRKTGPYQTALEKRNFYWNISDPNDPYANNQDTTFTLKRHTYSGNKDRSGAGPFTYFYGSTIMDYDYRIKSADMENTDMYGIYSKTVYPSFHNWEYDLGVRGDNTHSNWQPESRTQEVPSPGDETSPKDNNDGSQNRLTPSDDVYISTAGSSHTANFSTDEVYSFVEWYVKSPSDTSDKGTKVETDTGDGSATTASLSYMFSADAVAGSYIITASVTTSDGVYEVNYTVELSTVPGSPSLGSITIRSVNEIYVTWNSPSDDGGSSITEYEYRYKVSGSTEEGVWTSAGLALNATVSGFSSDTLYEIEVRAKNSVGYSEVSVSRSFMTLITPPAPVPPSPTAAPGKPTGLSVVSTSNGVVRISWSAPSDDGGGIDVYEYRIDANNDGSWGDWESLDSSNTSATLNLENGRSYGIEVRAKNSLGSSLQSTKVTAMPVDTSVSVPSAPRNLTAAAENGQVRLSWNIPSIGAGIIDYEYSYDTNDDGSWRSWRITNSTSTSYTVTGLTNETLYAFKVRARNAGGIGAESSKVTATPTALTVPTAPSSLTATYGNAEVTLSWTAPTSSGSSHIVRYEYRYATGQYPNHSAFTSWTSTGSTSAYYVVTGLTNGTQHLFQVRAVNNDNMESGTSNTAFSTPRAPLIAPTAPSSLTATYGNAEVTLSWTAPTSSGSSHIIRYEYRYATGQYPNHSAFTSWTSTGGTSTTYIVTGLTNGTQHLFQVRAVNNDNMKSGTTNTAFATPRAPLVAPTAPSSLTARRGTGQVTLSWTASASSGSSHIIRYEYRYATGQYPNHSAFTSWTSTGSTNTTYVVTGLTSGTQHLFQVRAVNNDNMESGTSNTAFSTPQ